MRPTRLSLLICLVAGCAAIPPTPPASSLTPSPTTIPNPTPTGSPTMPQVTCEPSSTGPYPGDSVECQPVQEQPRARPTATTFSIDVVNQSRVDVVVSVESDYGHTMVGFEPGQQGTVSIVMVDPKHGITVEVLQACDVLAAGDFPALGPFTLLVEDGPHRDTIKIETRAAASRTPMPLPSNSIWLCGG